MHTTLTHPAATAPGGAAGDAAGPPGVASPDAAARAPGPPGVASPDAAARAPGPPGAASPDALLDRFGLSAFRPGQREAVQAALDGRDTLVVMPTGGGKSLCYQLPALAAGLVPAGPERPLVVVVSPLIALMADQLRRLQQAGVRASMLASGMAEGHNAQALRELEEGVTQLVLAAPERFASAAFRRALARRPVGLFVVDEAHCVAEWGHDFRPDYLRLHDAIAALRGGPLGAGGGSVGAHGGGAGGAGGGGAGGAGGEGSGGADGGRAGDRDGGGLGAGGERAAARPAVMATTATATPRVAREIALRLGLREWVSIRSGFDRPNLAFDVVSVEGKGAVARKRAALVRVLGEAAARPAIVYCGTRRDAEEVAGTIAAEGIATVVYHAGMTPEARRESQQAFMAGAAEVVVATNAFGMGVDKADVRTVAHWALPTSLEAYYQEAGRAGRDGEDARALLLASRMDLGRLIRFIKERETSVEGVRRFVGRLRARAGREAHWVEEDGTASEGTGAPASPERCAADAVRPVVRVGHGELDDRERVLLSIAERAGAVVLEPAGGEGLLVTLTGRGSPRQAHAAIRAARDRAWESYRSIERYSAGGHTCRRRQILDHFGDRSPVAPVGRCCDVCDPDPALQAAVDAPVATSRPRRPAQAPAQVSEPVDERAFERLRAWRMERAEGKPAYTVATNAVLEEVLRRRPSTPRELLAIKGVGPALCDKHGDSLLAALASLPKT